MSNDHDLALLSTAIKEAAVLAMDWFGRRPEGWQKSDGSGPVSDADLAIDALLRDRLTTAKPEYAWLSEESEASPDRQERRRVWVVDPIDGTSAFLRGDDSFTVSVALIEDGIPILTALAAPALGELYMAERGGGATLNGEAVLPIQRRDTLDGAVLLARESLIDALVPATAGPFSGSIVHRVCMAALGRVDGALTTTPLMEWDVCGAHLFGEELGLTVVDATGAAFTYNKPDPIAPGIVCGSDALVAEIMEKLKRIELSSLVAG